MKKPHKAWWADKRNKDLATNIEGQKYALGFCKHLDMNSEAVQRQIREYNRILEYGLEEFDGQDMKQSTRQYKNYKSEAEYRKDRAEAMRYILDDKDVPYELGCRLKDEANYQESLNLLKQEQIRNHGNK